MRALLMTFALVTLTLVDLSSATSSTSVGGGAGSHSNMRQNHKHYRDQGQEGSQHRHHVPKRTLPNQDAQRQDPKKPPSNIRYPKLLEDSKLVHDTSHIKEELPKYIPPEQIKKMGPRELDYYYFKLHDFDDNRKLDGLELMKALGHVHGHDDDDDDDDHHDEETLRKMTPAERHHYRQLQRQKQEEDWKFYTELVDDVFEDNDKNKDGYLSYGEYVNGRNRNYGQQEYLDALD